MSSEYWREHIRGKQGRSVTPTFFISAPEGVTRTDGVTVKYLVVEEEVRGLKPGVYVQTNVTPESYDGDFDLRCAIRTHVQLDLIDRSGKAPTVGGTDFNNAIRWEGCAIAPNGALVLKITPAIPDDARQMLQNVELDPTSRMKFVPRTPNS